MRLSLFALALLLPLAACGSDPEPDAAAPEASGETEAGFGGPIRGELAVVETSTGGEVEVGVTDEVMFFRLSEASRAEVQKEMESESAEGGIGGAITDMIGGVVDKALATTVQMPLEQIQDVRYENGALVIEGTDKGATFDFGKGDRDGGLTFEPEAAQRIIDAYEAVR